MGVSETNGLNTMKTDVFEWLYPSVGSTRIPKVPTSSTCHSLATPLPHALTKMVVLCRSHHYVNREALLEVIKTYGGRTAYSFCAAAAKEKSDASGALLLSLGSSQTMQPTQLQSLLQSRELGGGETAPSEAAAVVSLKLLGVRQQQQLSGELGCDAEQDAAAAAAGAGADTPCSALGFDSTAGADGPGVATPRGAPLGPVIRPRSTLSLRSELLHCESVELDGDGAMAAAAAADEGEEEEEGKEEEGAEVRPLGQC